MRDGDAGRVPNPRERPDKAPELVQAMCSGDASAPSNPLASWRMDGNAYLNSVHKFRGPIAYKDPATNVVYYVESDGRHVSAIACVGTILWRRDPFLDANLEPYRVAHPQIVWIGKVERPGRGRTPNDFVGIAFNSTQFGLLRVETGEFLFEGQD